MHRFGCVTYLYTSTVGRTKLDDRCEQVIFLGYAETHKVFVVYRPRHKSRYTSVHVCFDDRSIGSGHQAAGEKEFIYDSLQFSPGYLETTDNLEDNPLSLIPPTNDGAAQEEPQEEPRPPQHQMNSQPHHILADRVPRVRKDWGPPICASARLAAKSNGAVAGNAMEGDGGAGDVDEERDPGTDPPDAVEEVLLVSGEEPQSYREATNSPDAAEWEATMDSEMQSIARLDTFELVPLPPGRKAIGTTWTYSVKQNNTGAIVRYKARLCAQGFSQVPGIDFQDLMPPSHQLSPSGCFARWPRCWTGRSTL